METLRLMLRKEWPLILSYGSLLAVLFFSEQLFGSLDTGTRIGVMFGWLFVVILLSAFAVVHHAESLAQKLGEPYGTLILTISVIGLEAIMIATVMLTKDENPKMARDTMYGVLMIVLNGLFGLAVLIGAWKRRFQSFNVQSSDTYVGCLIVLVGVGLFLPAFVPEKSIFMFEIYLIIICAMLYAIFLWVQTREHRGFFEFTLPGGEEVEDGHPDSPFGIGYHVALLIITLVPIVILAKQLGGGDPDSRAGRSGGGQCRTAQQSPASTQYLPRFRPGDHRVDHPRGSDHRNDLRPDADPRPRARGDDAGRVEHPAAHSQPRQG
jgi:Ca2+:H+ antiporter